MLTGRVGKFWADAAVQQSAATTAKSRDPFMALSSAHHGTGCGNYTPSANDRCGFAIDENTPDSAKQKQRARFRGLFTYFFLPFLAFLRFATYSLP
jgi:hypothetical protein